MSNTPNFFNPAAFNSLGEEQRKAMTAAFDAMANWRHELTAMSEKNSAAMFDKMSSAAKSLGWPTEFVDMTRQQMQNVMKLQTQAIDQMMDVWQKQATQPAAKLEMPTFPGMQAFGMGAGANGFPGMPSMSNMESMPMVPMQLWVQAAEMWQKSWQQALSTWMDTQKSMMNNPGGPKSGR